MIGTLKPDDFGSFEITFTAPDGTTSVPLQQSYKDNDGNVITSVQNIDLTQATTQTGSNQACSRHWSLSLSLSLALAGISTRRSGKTSKGAGRHATGHPVFRCGQGLSAQGRRCDALNHISFEVERGEFISIMGPSGSGKSTLLNLMGCLDTPTTGDIFISGIGVRDMTDVELTNLRRDRIGFIFQYFNLFPLLNIIENVSFPQMLKSRKRSKLRKAREVLRAVQTGRTSLTPTPLSNFREASNSGLRSHGRLLTIRISCSAMNQQVTSIQRPGQASWN